MDWSRRACSRRGHVLFEPEENEYLSQIRADTGLGTAWRCLRCGDFVLDVPVASGPAAEAPMPLRGKALRSRFIMRLLAVERIFRFLLVGAGAYAVWKFSNSEHAVQLLFERNLTIFRPVAQHYGYDLDSSSVVQTIRKIFTYKAADLDLAAAALGGYAAIELIEAVGLWLAKRWGEYFAAVATALFLPIEIYELTEHATKFKIGTLALNILAVVYLVWSKRLFGIRGGAVAYEAELTSESLLHEPATMPLPLIGVRQPSPAAKPNRAAVGSAVGGPYPNPDLASTAVTENAAPEPTVQIPLAGGQARTGAAEPTLLLDQADPSDDIVQA